MNIKAIIFDMDGTIIDTEHIWYKATTHILHSRSIDQESIYQSHILEKVHGLALDKSCMLLKKTFNLDDPLEVLMKEKSTFAINLYQHELKFIEGFTDFHKIISQHNIKSGIATNADDQTVHITSTVLNLAHYFGKHIYNISSVNNRCKPDPALYLHAADQLGVIPAECIAIEDSAYGIEAAQAAGMRCIGINTAHNKQMLANADLIVDTYAQIDFKKLYEE